MNLRELVLLLLKLFESSSSHLDEVIFYLPSSLYQHPVRLFELTRMLPELLPLFSFSYLRFEDDQIRRGVGKGVGKQFQNFEFQMNNSKKLSLEQNIVINKIKEQEREQEYRTLLLRVTESKNHLNFIFNFT
jgi:hypothetical protein